jgi:phytoene/squalene synthetase
MSVTFATHIPLQTITEPDSSILAARITRNSSTQTYYTIRLLADHDLAPDAYRAYAYFRWVDDILDADTGLKSEKVVFVTRQQSLLDMCYRGQPTKDVCREEQMLVDLVGHDHETNSGLHSYLYQMMAVMVFDVERRGRTITQSELDDYTESLSIAVMDALHYFIGHNSPTPDNSARYLAVQGAHIIHMLRDMCDDTVSGYFNIPREYLESSVISLRDMESQAYRTWVKSRIQLARQDFNAGRGYICQVKNLRCRLAGFAYTARFEWMLRTIESEKYHLRNCYPDRKSLHAGLWMFWTILTSALSFSKMS